MKLVRIFLTLTLLTAAIPTLSMDRPYAMEAAQAQAARQIIDPHSSINAWYGTPESDFRNIASAYRIVASYLFPSTKATNELKEFFNNYQKLGKGPKPLVANYWENWLTNQHPYINQLLNQGADPNAAAHSLSLLSMAIAYNDTALIDILRNSRIRTLFNIKNAQGVPYWFNADDRMSDYLLKLGLVDVNQKDDYGDTALIFSLNNLDQNNYYYGGIPNNKEKIQTLLKYNADPSIPNKQGETAVELARRKRLPVDIVQLLQNAIDNSRKQKLP